MPSTTFEYSAFDVKLHVTAENSPTVSFDGGTTWLEPVAVTPESHVFSVPDTYSLVADSVLISETNGQTTCIDPPMDFDIDRSHNIHYLNEKVFNFRTRVSDKTVFYHYLRSLLLSMDRSSKFFCGVISVLAFRVGENPEGRAELGRELIRIRSELIASKPAAPLDPVTLRWWISSGTNIIPLAEFYGLRDSAFDIAKDLYDMRDESAKAHIVYWNTASAMLLYSFYLYGKGRHGEASDAFLNTFILCRRGLSDIFSFQNKSILSQYPDCTALVEIGRNAFAAHAALNERKFSPGTTAEYPVDLAGYYIDFIGAVRRHDKGLPPRLGYFIQLKDRLNKTKNDFFNN
ncbi:hypothetical protein PS3A_02000 [Pseudomonas sp. 3A(2025)]